MTEYLHFTLCIKLLGTEASMAAVEQGKDFSSNNYEIQIEAFRDKIILYMHGMHGVFLNVNVRVILHPCHAAHL